jgi:hypothetical protein
MSKRSKIPGRHLLREHENSYRGGAIMRQSGKLPGPLFVDVGIDDFEGSICFLAVAMDSASLFRFSFRPILKDD